MTYRRQSTMDVTEQLKLRLTVALIVLFWLSLYRTAIGALNTFVDRFPILE